MGLSLRMACVDRLTRLVSARHTHKIGGTEPVQNLRERVMLEPDAVLFPELRGSLL